MLCCYRDGYLPRYPQGSTCPCVTGYFWALVTDGVAIHPKHAEDVAEIEKNREEERYKERERKRGGDMYTGHVSAARGRTTHIGVSIYQSERQIDSSIHQSTHQSIPQSLPLQNHELPHPHSNSSLHNSRVMRCTHPNSSSSHSPSSSSLHKPIISISHKRTADYLFTNTKTNVFLTTGMHGRHRRSRPWKWNLLPRNCRKWNRSDL